VPDKKRGGRPSSRPLIVKICPQCEDEFETKDEKKIHCGMKCSGLARRKVERPPEEVLRAEVATLGWEGTAAKHGVTANAVRKWLGQQKGGS
jgi:hypothetical protein